MSNPVRPQLRLPAEWESHDCVLMAWPHEDTDWAYMLDEARECFAEIVRAISERECVILACPEHICRKSIEAYKFDSSRVRIEDIPTNDTWARDFGPITIEKDGCLQSLDFKFNAWGMKFAADKDNLITTHLALNGRLNAEYVNRMGFVLEGGSIETDGKGTLLTTAECLLSPNRNGEMTEADIKEYLADTLGFTHQLWLRNGGMAGDDTDSHIDTLARIAPHDTIIYVSPTDRDGDTVESLARMREELTGMRTAEGAPFNLIELPLPSPIYDENGMQLPATYANYLVTPDAIYLPVYGQAANDLLAEQTLKIAYPDHEIIPIDCRALIQQHGSLHCVTMQLPTGAVRGIKDSRWEEKSRNL